MSAADKGFDNNSSLPSCIFNILVLFSCVISLPTVSFPLLLLIPNLNKQFRNQLIPHRLKIVKLLILLGEKTVNLNKNIKSIQQFIILPSVHCKDKHLGDDTVGSLLLLIHLFKKYSFFYIELQHWQKCLVLFVVVKGCYLLFLLFWSQPLFLIQFQLKVSALILLLFFTFFLFTAIETGYHFLQHLVKLTLLHFG